MAENLDMELVKTFLDNVRLAEGWITKGQVGLARDQYFQLLTLYKAIQDSSLGMQYKQGAYQELTRIYQCVTSANPTQALASVKNFAEPQLQAQQVPQHVSVVVPTAQKMETPRGISITTQTPQETSSKRSDKPIYAAIILLFALGSVMLAKPEWLGMVTFEGLPRITEDVHLSFNANTTSQLTLRHIPSGLGISGRFAKTSEEGYARLIAIIDGKRQVLFDSSRSSMIAGIFRNTCLDCGIPSASGKNVKLLVELADATLDINQVTYTVESQNNNAPEFVGNANLNANGKTTVDLNTYFKDKDSDVLVFTATRPETAPFDVSMDGSKLTITPKTQGSMPITIVASDLLEVTKATLQVTAQ